MRISRRLAGIVATAAMVGAFVLPSAPAHATVTGATLFHCTASLPEFPSTAGNAGTCDSDGVDPSVALGAGGGLDQNGDPYAVTGLGHFHAAFNYSESCVAGEPPALGAAGGTASVTGLTAVGLPNKTPQTGGADLNTAFTWTRVGAVAVIITGPTTVTLYYPNGNKLAQANVFDVAVAGFAPILGAGNTCPDGGSLKAKVVGVDVDPA